MNGENIYTHFRKEEHPFIERMIELTNRVEQYHDPIRTDFVDPRQFYIVQTIVNSSMDLTMFYDGGYEGAERVRVLIAPDYWSYKREEFGLVVFRMKGENKFTEIKHKDILGAMMNIGIKREKFGDIIISEEEKQIVVAVEIADYLQVQLQQIGRTKVSLERLKLDEIIQANVHEQVKSITVSSMRLDAIISHVYNLSRAKAADLIKTNRVKVNWQNIDQTDYSLATGDMISLKGFGRFVLKEDEGETKKGRKKIKIAKIL